MIFGLYKVLTIWANKRINKNRENKKLNTKIMIEQFFKLTGIKKTKVYIFIKSWLEIFIKLKALKN